MSIVSAFKHGFHLLIHGNWLGCIYSSLLTIEPRPNENHVYIGVVDATYSKRKKVDRKKANEVEKDRAEKATRPRQPWRRFRFGPGPRP